MGILGKIFGSDKAIDDVLDKDRGLLARTGEWVGNMHFTEEEQAEANQHTREWGLRQLEALQPFRIVQRILALSVCIVWIGMAFNIVAAIWLGNEFAVDNLLTFAFSEFTFWPIMAVFSLYCAGGVLPDGILRGNKKK